MSPELTNALVAAHRAAQLAASNAREALSYAQTALRKAQEAADEADLAAAHIAGAFKIVEQDAR
jgi:hypothetical protein